MVTKKIIEKTINHIIVKNNLETVKCSKSTLDKADKEFIEQFEKDKDTFPNSRDERHELWFKHCKVQAKHKYPQFQKHAISYWGHSGYHKINGKIYDTREYNEEFEDGLINESQIDDYIKKLQAAIDDGPKAPHDTVTVRTGHWESGHKPGEVIVQDGFASTSYTDRIDASETSSEYSYDITYYIRTGTKCVALDSDYFDCLPEEELLLGRGTRQYILEQDDDNQTVSVLILPDR